MSAYERNSAAYFATPPVNLIYAYHASLCQITQGNVSFEDRFKAHKEASRRIKKAVEDLGLKCVPLSEDAAANGMTAVSPHVLIDQHIADRCMSCATLDLLPRWPCSERHNTTPVEKRHRCCRWLAC